MTYHKNPLRFNVGFLLKQPIGTNRDIPIDDAEVRFSDDFSSQELTGMINFGRTPEGILVTGTLKARVPQECVRCLGTFSYSTHAAFSELYAFSWKTATDSDLVLSEDADIDLLPIVREYLLLDIPIQPVCQEDCKGLCPECGEDLNKSSCEHARKELDAMVEDAPDTRMARALRKALSESS